MATKTRVPKGSPKGLDGAPPGDGHRSYSSPEEAREDLATCIKNQGWRSRAGHFGVEYPDLLSAVLSNRRLPVARVKEIAGRSISRFAASAALGAATQTVLDAIDAIGHSLVRARSSVERLLAIQEGERAEKRRASIARTPPRPDGLPTHISEGDLRSFETAYFALEKIRLQRELIRGRLPAEGALAGLDPGDMGLEPYRGRAIPEEKARYDRIRLQTGHSLTADGTVLDQPPDRFGVTWSSYFTVANNIRAVLEMLGVEVADHLKLMRTTELRQLLEWHLLRGLRIPTPKKGGRPPHALAMWVAFLLQDVATPSFSDRRLVRFIEDQLPEQRITQATAKKWRLVRARSSVVETNGTPGFLATRRS